MYFLKKVDPAIFRAILKWYVLYKDLAHLNRELAFNKDWGTSLATALGDSVTFGFRDTAGLPAEFPTPGAPFFRQRNMF